MRKALMLASLVVGLACAQVPGGVVEVNGAAVAGLSFIRQNGDVFLPVEGLGTALGMAMTTEPTGHFLFLGGQAHKIAGVVVANTVYAPWWALQPMLAGYALDIHGETVDLHKGAAPVAGAGNAAAIVEELNLARTNPQAYAQILEARRAWYGPSNQVARPGGRAYISREGKVALEDAIAFLHHQTPLTPVSLSAGMSRAAADFVTQNGPTGVKSHQGPDGSLPADRVARYGNWGGTMGENLDYGWSDARDIVADLIIDDGVPDRGHRANVFEPAFHVVGVAVGPNKVSHVMCVMEFAAEYHEK
ncbi:MAG TPA: CAP domain-containing protein [Candidatus Xenobia bacterium]|jgi:hypothetical protein